MAKRNKSSIGALWLHQKTDDFGKKTGYMTGHIDLGALGQIKITVFKNGYKQEDSQQPDYNIVLSEPRRQEEPPIVEEPNDEIPF